MNEGLIEIEDKRVLLLWWFSEIWRGTSRKGLEHIVILLYDVLVIVEINGVKSQQLVKGTVDGHVSGLELSNDDLQLLVESGIGLENGEEFFRDEENCCSDLLLDMDVVLADLGLEGLKTSKDVVGKRSSSLLQHA